MKDVRHKTLECTTVFIWSSKIDKTIQRRQKSEKQLLEDEGIGVDENTDGAGT